MWMWMRQAVLRHHLDAIAGRHQAPVHRQEHRAVNGFAQHTVGDAQGVCAGAQRNQGKIRHYHKAKHQRLLGWLHGARGLGGGQHCLNITF